MPKPINTLVQSSQDQLNAQRQIPLRPKTKKAPARRATAPADLRAPARLQLQTRFELCKETIKLQTAGNEQEITEFNKTKNPYLSSPADSKESKKQKIYNSFVLLTLLHNQHKAAKTRSTFEIFERTFQFLEMNGANSFTLKNQLDQLYQDPGLESIMDHLKNETLSPTNYAHILNHNIDDQGKPIIKSAIPNQYKIPAELSGLRHTLCKGSNQKWYETYPYYELDNAHDKAIIGQAHQHGFEPQIQTEKLSATTSIYKVILGKGSTAKVIPAHDIAEGELVAIKKYDNVRECTRDYGSYENAVALIPDHLKHHFLQPITFHMGKGKKAILQKLNQEKGNTIFPLGIGDNGYKEILRNNLIRHMNKQSQYEDRCYRQALMFAEKTNVLDEMKVVFLDLKPENIVGNKLIDFGSLAPLKLPFEVTMHTFPYTMPQILRKNMTLNKLETSNRFNLGVMLFNQITGQNPTKESFDPLLRLPGNIKYNQVRNVMNPEDGYPLTGFSSETLEEIPDRLFADSDRVLTPFEKEMLKLAKQLMAEDRNQASAKTLDLKARLEAIGKLRQSQTQIRHTQSV